MEYKQLKTLFTRKGFTHKELIREGDKAIYEQSKGKKIKMYEVVKIRRHDGYKLGEIYVEPSETYPSDSEWGTFGWTFNDLDLAKKKFNSI